jgi:hypothetical protein
MAVKIFIVQAPGQSLCRVFNFRNGCVHDVHFHCYGLKLPNLKLKTWPTQLLGSPPLENVLPKQSPTTTRVPRLICAGTQMLIGENLKAVWAKNSTLSSAVLLLWKRHLN